MRAKCHADLSFLDSMILIISGKEHVYNLFIIKQIRDEMKN
jgi:hypothetical protein